MNEHVGMGGGTSAGGRDPESVKSRWQSTQAQFFGIGAFYVAVVIFFAFTSDYFFSYSNALNILTNVTVIGIVALGQTLAIVSGGFDLSVSGVVPLGAVTFVIFGNAEMATPAAMLLAVLVGAVVGVCNGLIVTKVGINPLIATLGTLSIAAGLAYALSNGVTIPMKNIEVGVLAERTYGRVPYYVVTLIGLSLVIWFAMRFTVIGRRIYAIGGNREASRLAGLRVDEITIAIYATCAGLAAFAGVVVSSQLSPRRDQSGPWRAHANHRFLAARQNHPADANAAPGTPGRRLSPSPEPPVFVAILTRTLPNFMISSLIARTARCSWLFVGMGVWTLLALLVDCSCVIVLVPPVSRAVSRPGVLPYMTYRSRISLLCFVTSAS